MAKGFKHGASGGNPLNFRVIAYATEEELNAATPKENTIGVITTEKITSWYFITTEPEAPEEGMVWIFTGKSSAVEFNALKKNGIQVYPISVRQYISGAWVGVTAKVYQDGEWADWLTIIYDTQYGFYFPITTTTNISGTGNIVDGVLTLVTSNENEAAIYNTTTEKINLTNVNSIIVEGEGNGGDFGLYVSDTNTPHKYTLNKSGTGSEVARTISGYILDVSVLSGEYYIGVGIYNYAGGAGKYFEVRRWYLV